MFELSNRVDGWFESHIDINVVRRSRLRHVIRQRKRATEPEGNTRGCQRIVYRHNSLRKCSRTAHFATLGNGGKFNVVFSQVCGTASTSDRTSSRSRPHFASRSVSPRSTKLNARSTPQARRMRSSESTVGDRRPDSYSTIAAGEVPTRRASSRLERRARVRADVMIAAAFMSPAYGVLSDPITLMQATQILEYRPWPEGPAQ